MLRRLCLLACCAILARAADLTVHLPGDALVSHKMVRFRCDANATKFGLPADAFPVEYINGGGNSLAVVPISGMPTIFVTVLSGSGARYAAKQYTWWEAHGTVTVSSTSGNGQSSCHPMP